MKKIISSLLFLFLLNSAFSQKILVTDLKALKKKEDSLKTYALQIIQGRIDADRFKADSIFTKMFVRALKIPNSFNYHFDSLITISRLSPPDSSFKIFTWQMVISDNVVRQHGAIQMRTSDGSLKLFPLIDKSDVTVNMTDTIGNNFGWMGAVYYRIIEKQAFGKNYYTLLGYDENSLSSNKKIIEVLTFANGQPVFGGSYFSIKDNELSKNFGNRFIMEYKKSASPTLNYDDERDVIIFEELISESGEPQKKYTNVGDGEYNALRWQDGKWVQTELATEKIKKSKEQLPNPIRDDKGAIDETKLKDNTPPDEKGDDNQQDPSKTKEKTTPAKIKVKKK